MASTKRLKLSLNLTITTTSSYQTVSLSAQVIANNDDLLSEILLRLPVSSLLIFKSVSKHWLSVISNPQFCRRFSPHHNLASGLFLLRPNAKFDFINLKQGSIHSYSPFRSLSFVDNCYKLLQSCNGLFLYCTSRGLDRRKKYYVYNPTTKHYTILPQLPVRCGISTTGLSLAFDPSRSPHYKVICVQLCNSIETKYQVEIYSLEAGPWRLCSRTFQTPFPLYETNYFNGGVYWNGSVHWISTLGAAKALYLNIDEESLNEMPLPPIPEGWDDRKVGYFGESGGHLHLIGIYDETPSTQCNVYKMEMDYSSWLVKFRVDFNEVSVAFPETIHRFFFPQDLANFIFSIICVVRCEVDEESYLVMYIPGGIIVYYLKTKTFKKVCDVHGFQRDCLLCRGWSIAFLYVESLSCV